jgi:hypothetical protein
LACEDLDISFLDLCPTFRLAKRRRFQGSCGSCAPHSTPLASDHFRSSHSRRSLFANRSLAGASHQHSSIYTPSRETETSRNNFPSLLFSCIPSACSWCWSLHMTSISHVLFIKLAHTGGHFPLTFFKSPFGRRTSILQIAAGRICGFLAPSQCRASHPPLRGPLSASQGVRKSRRMQLLPGRVRAHGEELCQTRTSGERTHWRIAFVPLVSNHFLAWYPPNSR